MSRSLVVALALALLVAGIAQAQPPPPPAPEAPPEPPPADPEPAPIAVNADVEIKNACVSAFTSAQRLRRAGKLLAARNELINCANTSCPEILRKECIPWLEQVGVEIPSVVITVRNPQGNAIPNVTVEMDGEVITTELDGLPIEVDPGPHQFVMQSGDRPYLKRTVIVPQGSKNFPVTAQFFDRFDEKGQPVIVKGGPFPPIPALAWVGGGIAAAGLITGTVLGIVAVSRADTIREECNDGLRCTEAEISEAEDIAIASTTAFAFAGGGLALGLIAMLVAWPSETTAVSLAPDGVRLSF